jgi:hypothetical protein
MIKKQISILVPARLVDLADQTAAMLGQSRAFVMTRWMLEALVAEAEEVVEYFPSGLGNQAQDLEKNRGIPGPRERAQFEVGGGVLVEYDAARAGSPGPGFGGRLMSDAERYNKTPDEIAQFRKRISDGLEVVSGGPDAVMVDLPVPEEALGLLKTLDKAAGVLSGADPVILAGAEKPDARTATGVNAAESHRAAKRKKIASVSAPGAAPAVAPTPDFGGAPGQDVVVPKQANEINPHDSSTCKVYGCLMCKAEEEF